MVIHYCAACEAGIPEHELVSGHAVKLDQNTVFCARCIQTGEVVLPKPLVAPAAPHTILTDPQAEAARKSGIIPAVVRTGSGLLRATATEGGPPQPAPARRPASSGIHLSVQTGSAIQNAVKNSSGYRPAVRAHSGIHGAVQPPARGGKSAIMAAVPGASRSGSTLQAVSSRTSAAREKEALSQNTLIFSIAGMVVLFLGLILAVSSSGGKPADKSGGKTPETTAVSRRASDSSRAEAPRAPAPPPAPGLLAPETAPSLIPAPAPAPRPAVPPQPQPADSQPLPGLMALSGMDSAPGTPAPAKAPSAATRVPPPAVPPAENAQAPAATDAAAANAPDAAKPVLTTPRQEYERALAAAYECLYRNAAPEAEGILRKALSDPKLSDFKNRLGNDLACVEYYADASRAARNGAALLADKRTFTLKRLKGPDIDLFALSPVYVSGITGSTINLLHNAGSGTVSSQVTLEELTPHTRYELAALGLPAEPERQMKLAFAGLMHIPDGLDFPSIRGIRAMLDQARKEKAPAVMIDHLRACVDLQETLLTGRKRFAQIEAAIKGQHWTTAQSAIDEFQKDYEGSYVLLRSQADLENYKSAMPESGSPRKRGLWASYWSPGFKTLNHSAAETSLEFAFKDRGPVSDVKPDAMGLRYRGCLRIEAEGVYMFSAAASGQVSLRIDGQTVLDTKTGLKGQITLSKGMRDVQIEFTNTSGQASLSLKWTPPNASAWTAIPAEVLWHSDEHKKP